MAYRLMTAEWKVLGSLHLSRDVKAKIVRGVLAEAGSRSVDELAARRDAVLLELLALRAKD